MTSLSYSSASKQAAAVLQSTSTAASSQSISASHTGSSTQSLSNPPSEDSWSHETSSHEGDHTSACKYLASATIGSAFGYFLASMTNLFLLNRLDQTTKNIEERIGDLIETTKDLTVELGKNFEYLNATRQEEIALLKTLTAEHGTLPPASHNVSDLSDLEEITSIIKMSCNTTKLSKQLDTLTESLPEALANNTCPTHAPLNTTALLSLLECGFATTSCTPSGGLDLPLLP